MFHEWTMKQKKKSTLPGLIPVSHRTYSMSFQFWVFIWRNNVEWVRWRSDRRDILKFICMDKLKCIARCPFDNSKCVCVCVCIQWHRFSRYKFSFFFLYISQKLIRSFSFCSLRSIRRRFPFLDNVQTLCFLYSHFILSPFCLSAYEQGTSIVNAN